VLVLERKEEEDGTSWAGPSLICCFTSEVCFRLIYLVETSASEEEEEEFYQNLIHDSGTPVTWACLPTSALPLSPIAPVVLLVRTGVPTLAGTCSRSAPPTSPRNRCPRVVLRRRPCSLATR